MTLNHLKIQQTVTYLWGADELFQRIEMLLLNQKGAVFVKSWTLRCGTPKILQFIWKKKVFCFFCFVFWYLTVFKGLLSMQQCWLCFEHLKSSAIYLTNDLEKEICKWKLCVKNKDKYMQTGPIVLVILWNQDNFQQQWILFI